MLFYIFPVFSIVASLPLIFHRLRNKEKNRRCCLKKSNTLFLLIFLNRFNTTYYWKNTIKFFLTFPAGYKPAFGFVVVQKRINARIFSRINNVLSNPAPGTVVDHTITRKMAYDFFLVSQKVGQGTVTPTHMVSTWIGSSQCIRNNWFYVLRSFNCILV